MIVSFLWWKVGFDDDEDDKKGGMLPQIGRKSGPTSEASKK